MDTTDEDARNKREDSLVGLSSEPGRFTNSDGAYCPSDSDDVDFTPAQLAAIRRNMGQDPAPLPPGVEDVPWRAPSESGLDHSAAIFNVKQDSQGELTWAGLNKNQEHFRSWQQDNGIAATFGSAEVKKCVDGTDMMVRAPLESGETSRACHVSRRGFRSDQDSSTSLPSPRTPKSNKKRKKRQKRSPVASPKHSPGSAKNPDNGEVTGAISNCKVEASLRNTAGVRAAESRAAASETDDGKSTEAMAERSSAPTQPHTPHPPCNSRSESHGRLPRRGRKLSAISKVNRWRGD